MASKNHQIEKPRKETVMKRLAIAKNETIKISPDYFDVNDIQKMLGYDYSKLTISDALKASAQLELMKPSEILGISIAEDESVADVFRKVVDLFQDDNELGDTVRSTRAAEEERNRNMLVEGIASEINLGIAKNNENSFHAEKKFDGELVSYFIDDEVVIQFDRSQVSALNATKIETIVAWVKLVWDAVSFLGTVIGIAVPKSNNKATKKLTELLGKAQQMWQKFINAMKKIKDAVKASEKIKYFIGAWRLINLAKQGKKVFKAIFSSLKWHEKAWIVIKFAATVALLFVSAGANLIAKLIKAVAQLVKVIADVEEISNLEAQTT